MSKDLEKFICRGLRLNADWEHFIRLPLIDFKCGHRACRRCVGFTDNIQCNMCKQTEAQQDIGLSSNSQAESSIRSNMEQLGMTIYEKLQILAEDLSTCSPLCQAKLEKKFESIEKTLFCREQRLHDQIKSLLANSIQQNMFIINQNLNKKIKSAIVPSTCKKSIYSYLDDFQGLVLDKKMTEEKLNEFNEKLKQIQNDTYAHENFETGITVDPNTKPIKVKNNQKDHFYFGYQALNNKLDNGNSINHETHFYAVRLLQLKNGNYVCSSSSGNLSLFNPQFKMLKKQKPFGDEKFEYKSLMHDQGDNIYVWSREFKMLRRYDCNINTFVNLPLLDYLAVYFDAKLVYVCMCDSILVYDHMNFYNGQFKNPINVMTTKFKPTDIVVCKQTMCLISAPYTLFFTLPDYKLLSQHKNIYGKLFAYNQCIYVYSKDKFHMFDKDGFLLQCFQINLSSDYKLLSASNKYFIFQKDRFLTVCQLSDSF